MPTIKLEYKYVEDSKFPYRFRARSYFNEIQVWLWIDKTFNPYHCVLEVIVGKEYYFTFRNKDDAMKFKLVWGG
jgi:hypothetical protein